MNRKLLLLGICFFYCITTSFAQIATAELKVNLTFSKEIKSQVQNEGRVYIFLSQNEGREPRKQTVPFPGNIAHIFAQNLSNINTKKPLLLDYSSDWTKTTDWSLHQIPQGDYYVQVLWDQANEESRINVPGNLYSTSKSISINGEKTIDLQIDQQIPKRELVDHDLVKLVDFKSDTLSKWWDKPMKLKASILLPSAYDAKKTYPIRYNVAGYGGRYDRINRLVEKEEFITWWEGEDSPQVINVFLDGEGPYGDSYQMDSENSGPYGYALIYELIPYIEGKYRGTNNAKTRFVDGCSTGGWVSLGLQLYYPDHFNGVFSYSPDAVEFENYQLINIYKDKNAFENEFGYLRPVARMTDGEPFLSMKQFITYENVLSPSNNYLKSGGQFSAHTALYSPKGTDGLPKPLFDPHTGAIDSSVAEHWKKYDFKLYAKENWDTLGPKLAGKIYIWMGDMDHFYLNMATRSFADFMESTESPRSDAEIVFSPLEGHCSQFSDKVVLEKIQERLNAINE